MTPLLQSQDKAPTERTSLLPKKGALGNHTVVNISSNSEMSLRTLEDCGARVFKASRHILLSLASAGTTAVTGYALAHFDDTGLSIFIIPALITASFSTIYSGYNVLSILSSSPKPST